jgi:hypothetical protein
MASAAGSTSSQYSRMQRSSPSRVVQKERSRQPGFFGLGLPFFRCSLDCSGSATTLQLAFSWATRRFEGCAAPLGS